MQAPLRLRGTSDPREWREVVRELLVAGVAPHDVMWTGSRNADLFGVDASPSPPPAESGAREIRVPKEFIPLANQVLHHKDEVKWDLLYRLAWRLAVRGESGLLTNPADDDVSRAVLMAKAVKRDVHKMKAFVRFRRIEDEAGERYVAFHKPEHPIVPLAAPFFARRFAVMRWSILTPTLAAHWDGESLTFEPPSAAMRVPREDELESYWRTYYANVFNPARVNPRAMQKEMPKKYWSTLPEADIIDDLLRQAPTRVTAMRERMIGAQGAAAFAPAQLDARPVVALQQLAAAAAVCEGCQLCEQATQTVCGAGNAHARIMLVGEQPGDEEDRLGKPFVGPAGSVLTAAMEQAGLSRDDVFITNAVKHFGWTPDPRGKRRIHAKPGVTEVRACRPWLERELAIIKPQVLVLLGSTASQSLLGSGARVTQLRGRVLTGMEWAPSVIVTLHPSAILRSPPAMRDVHLASLVHDLSLAASALGT